MKRTIMALGYIFMALIAVLIVSIVTLYLVGQRLDRESKAFVDAAIPAITADWDIEELKKRASPELEDAIDFDDMEHYFGTLGQLGALKEYEGSEGEANIALSIYGYEITADYASTADFETGFADIEISLIKHGQLWQILDLKIKAQPFEGRKNII